MYRTFWTSQVPSSIYWRWHALTIGHCKWAGGYTLKHGLLTYLSSVNGHFSKTIAWFVRHNPTAKKWMQVILILENQERPIVFAFYKYLLARRKNTPTKLYSQDDTWFMMIHHLFSWISYISIFLGVLKIMNHISPTGRPNPNLHSRKVNEPLCGCARIVQTNGGGWCSTLYTFLNKLILSVFKNIFCKCLRHTSALAIPFPRCTQKKSCA